MTGNVYVMQRLLCRARSRHKGGAQSRGSRPRASQQIKVYETTHP